MNSSKEITAMCFHYNGTLVHKKTHPNESEGHIIMFTLSLKQYHVADKEKGFCHLVNALFKVTVDGGRRKAH